MPIWKCEDDEEMILFENTSANEQPAFVIRLPADAQYSRPPPNSGVTGGGDLEVLANSVFYIVPHNLSYPATVLLGNMTVQNADVVSVAVYDVDGLAHNETVRILVQRLFCILSSWLRGLLR